MKTKFTFLITAMIAVCGAYGQLGLDSTFIYDEAGIKHWYYIQKDVYCFKIDGSAEYTGSVNPCVDVLDYWNTAPSQFNEICFNPGSSAFQRASQVMTLQSMSDYEISSYALTKNATADYTAQEYYRTDDQILVTFNDPLIDASVVNAFATTYSLSLVHQPSASLSNLVSWTYIFRIIPIKGEETNSIKLAQEINENEPTLVKLAEPNMYSVEQLACAPTTEVGLAPGGTDGTWHIRNTGGVVWSGFSGANDADADICECWGEGYTGTGIKVALIDFGGIEFSHPDFAGTNLFVAYNALTGFDETSDFYLNPLNGHGMQVTGVVGATPNNTSLGQRWAVGSAYNAEVRPYINQTVSETDLLTSNGQIILSLQKAVLDQVDVINMSWRTSASFGSIETQINNATTVGRPDGSGGYYGIVCVAAVGNDNLDGSNFPANLPNVIGVGWTNPEDYRSAYDSPAPNGGGWTTNPGVGSTYGPPTYNYDVVAPGELIMTTDISTTPGLYITSGGSSFASPIVASIAAIILDKNPNLTWTQVRDLIRNGAEQVNPGTYDYNMFGGTPGYNNEMFYGRVSCINSINQTPLSVEENKEQVTLTVWRQDLNNYLVFIPQSVEGQSYELYDMSGRILSTSIIQSGSTELLIDLTAFTSGMYILKITNGSQPIATAKLIK